MSGEASAAALIADGRVRVTRFDMSPHDRIAWHRHEFDYLVVPLTDGAVEVRSAAGSSMQEFHAGEPYQRPAGAEHELVNGAHPYSFIEIEFVQPRSR